MKRNTLNKVLLLGTVLLAFSACKTRKIVVTAPPVVKTDTMKLKKSENLALLNGKNIDFNTLSLKGKAQLSLDGNSNNVSVNIRVRKDEKIWIILTAFAGIEVGRAMITPDSLRIINKIQETYLNAPFSYIHRFTSKQVNFKLLQDVFAGNVVGAFMNENADLDLQQGLWQLRGKQGELNYQILFNTLLKASETDLNDVRAARALKVVYGEYQQVDDYLFPSSMKLNTVTTGNKIELNLSFSKIERNVEVDFPFTVPKRFKAMN